MVEPANQETETPSTSESAAWRVMFDELKARDEIMVKEYQEEIDTLLVFVRLFLFSVFALAYRSLI
jgi:hypothetical protein